MHMHFTRQHTVGLHKDGGRSEGADSKVGCIIRPHPVEIGLTDLAKSGGYQTPHRDDRPVFTMIKPTIDEASCLSGEFSASQAK